MHLSFDDGRAVSLAVMDVNGRHIDRCATLQFHRLAHCDFLARRQSGIGKHRVVAWQKVLKLIHSVGTSLYVVAKVSLVAIDDKDIGLGSGHGVGRQGEVIIGMMHQFHDALYRARAAFARSFIASRQGQSHSADRHQKSCNSVHFIEKFGLQKYKNLTL